jgi:hypothetical protein
MLSAQDMCHERVLVNTEFDIRLRTNVDKPLTCIAVISFRKSKRIHFIFNDESTGSCICLRLDLYMSHVKHDTIITCATALCFCFYLSSPTPLTNRSHTCAYVTRMKDNV